MFARSNLFGTYQPKKKDFEFMSYGDFGREVDRCRIVLRNMGGFVLFPRHFPRHLDVWKILTLFSTFGY